VDLFNKLRGGGELKQVIAVRADLKLKKGKLAAQVAHAAVSAAERSPDKDRWLQMGQKKSVVQVKNEAELLEVYRRCWAKGLPAALIEDAGRTQLPPSTKTCVGIGPAPADDIDEVTGDLKLL